MPGRRLPVLGAAGARAAEAPSGTNRPAFVIRTWGCQMNVHDSEKMAGALRVLGYDSSSDANGADVVLLNTCAVRDKATQKVYHALGRLRRLKERNPNLVIGVTGCVAQLEGEAIFRRAPHVDLVLGPRGIGSLPKLLEEARTGRVAQLMPIEDDLRYPFETTAREGRVKAFVTVMEGCDKACTFCIVPKTRGAEECRSPVHVLAEVGHLAERGFREVELLGQNVNAYRHGGTDFAALLRQVGRVDGIERVRFTTSHPLHFSDAIIEAMAESPRVCPAVHLPAQSGADRVLRRMRRGYSRARYLDRVRRLRAAVAGVAVSTDIIVGFPGETAEEFEETMGLLEEARFEQVFSFVYSPRPGTVASRLDDPVQREEKEARLARLQARQQEIQAELLAARVGARLPVLVEGPARRGDGVYVGRSPENFVVHFPGSQPLIGRIVPVSVHSSTALALYGDTVADPAPGPSFP